MSTRKLKVKLASPLLLRSGDGYGRGEGFASMVLQRTSAPTGGVDVLVVLKGSAINQDGRSSGLTAPNGPSQAALVK